MTALSHPHMPGLTVEIVGSRILVALTSEATTLTSFSPTHARRLADALYRAADLVEAGWTGEPLATEVAPPPARTEDPPVATSPESTA